MEKKLKLVVCAVMSIRWRTTEEFLYELVEDFFAQAKRVDGIDATVVLSYESLGDGDWKVFEKLTSDFPNLKLLPSEPKKISTAQLYLKGFEFALKENADLVLEIDCSGAHDTEQMPLFISKAVGYLQKNPNSLMSVMSTRFSFGGQNYFPWGRVFLSKLTTFFSRWFLMLGKSGRELKDLTSGFEIFSGPLLRKMFEVHKPSGWVSLWWGPLHLFQTEARALVCWIAKKHNVKIFELPIVFAKRFKGKKLPPLSKKYMLTALTGGFLLLLTGVAINLKLMFRK
jgi:hypothetical protein